MMYKRTKRNHLACGLIAAGLLLGQSTFAQAEPPTALSFEYQVYYLSGSNKALSKQELMEGKRYEATKPPELYTLKEGAATELSIRNNEISSTYAYNGPAPFRLYKKIIVEDTPQFKPVASLPENMRIPAQALLMLLGSEEKGYQIIPLDVSPKNLRDGQILIMNLSKETLAARTRSSTIEIPGAQSATIAMGELKNQRFQLSVAVHEADQWKMIYNSFLTRRDGVPLLALVYPSNAGRAGWKVQLVDSSLFQ